VLGIFLLWFLGAGITAAFPVWLFGAVVYLAPAKIPARFQGLFTMVLTAQFLCVLFLMRSIAVGGVKADLIIGLSFTLMLYAILHQVGPASASLYSRLAHTISFPSYSLYAIHMPLIVLLAAFCESRFPSVFRHTELICAVISVFVLAYAAIFYRLFERNTDHVRRFVEAHLVRHRASGNSNIASPSSDGQRLCPVKVSSVH